MKVRSFIIAAVLCFGPATAQTTVSGTISSNRTWSGIVTVTGNVTIQNAVVTIQPGTEVRLQTGLGIAIKTNGGIKAIGTAADQILFTTTSPFKTAGQWAELDLYENINVAQTTFRHCIFECGKTMLDFRSSNHDAIKATSANTIEDCIFRKSTTSAIYITSGGSPTIRRCTFEDCNTSGIFAHGAGTVRIEYCDISNASVGIICAGEPSWGWNQIMYLDHCTIHYIRGALKASPTWWTGMGIYCSGDDAQRGTMTLTNSIFTDIEWPSHYCAGLQIGAWTVNNDYNCWYNAGVVDVDGGDPGAHAVEADPKFISASDPSLGLQASSPCAGTADDGGNIGASQITASSVIRRVAGDHPEVPAVFVRDGVLHAQNLGEPLSVYRMDGTMAVRLVPTAGSAVWNAGSRPGVYLYRAGASGPSGSFVIAE